MSTKEVDDFMRRARLALLARAAAYRQAAGQMGGSRYKFLAAAEWLETEAAAIEAVVEISPE